jgi:phage terminase small subunit
MTEKNSILKDRKRMVDQTAMAASEITPQMREFCEAYLWCDTATAAAVHAGYSKNTATVKASKLLDDERVQEYIKCLQAMREVTSALTSQSLIRLQLALHDKAIESDDLKAANTALDQLAKMLGTYNSTKGKIAAQGNDTNGEPITKDKQEDMIDLVKSIEERSKTVA